MPLTPALSRGRGSGKSPEDPHPGPLPQAGCPFVTLDTVWVVCYDLPIMWVCGQYFGSDLIRRIQSVIHEEPTMSRRTLSKLVCDWLDWRAPDGKLQDMSCRKALAEVERRGLLDLSEAGGGYAFQRPRIAVADRVANVGQVTCSLEDLGPLEIEPVSSRFSKTSRVWNELLDRFHYLGAGPIVGAQIRYVVRSETHGWIGALAFSAAAKRLKARDEEIEWSDRARIANLQLVVCNSRFLIPETVRVPNLASHVLARSLARLPEDWDVRYGYRPVLVETFVDPERYQGVCYRAANWMHVGQTAGRSSPFANGTVSTGAKDIYLYPIAKDWQSVLQAEPPRDLLEGPSPGRDAEWAEVEFGRTEVYDQRLKQRLYTVARDFYASPGALVPQASGGSFAKAQATYRLMSNPRISLDTVLRSHVAATTERIGKHDIVLAVQDTTTLNYGTHRLTEGLGPINTSSNKAMGLLLHDTVAFTVGGAPLGVLDAQSMARDPKEKGKSKRRKELPIEKKESFRWIKSYRAVAEVQKYCPETTLVVIGDRESDIYDLFAETLGDSNKPELLIRAERGRQRQVDDGRYLWHKLAHEPVAGSFDLHVPRRQNQPARTARLVVRHRKVQLKPPKNKKLDPVQIWAVYVREVNYDPEEVPSPLEWMLLTTVSVADFYDARTIIEWYTRRWGIEDYHRVLKSGCRIESRHLTKADRLETALAIDMVVAWRILNLTRLGRETPDAPCTVMLDADEWRALHWHVAKKPPPNDPIPVQEAVRMIAKIGGFLGRKSDGEPGMTTIWRGLERLSAITEHHKLLISALARDGPHSLGVTCDE